MIRERNIVPGRILGRKTFESSYDPIEKRYKAIERIRPCMVISFIPVIKRRHSKGSAPREGWNVLVMWLDDEAKASGSLLCEVNIPNVYRAVWTVLW